MTYTELGCFQDREDRAITGQITFYSPDEAIKKCFERALRLKYSHFAVQYNNECFTSRNAATTYNRWGAGVGCRNGRGGSHLLTVYKIISPNSRK